MQKELQLHNLTLYYEKSKRNMPLRKKWIKHIDETGIWRECPVCHAEKQLATNFCPDCGERLEE